MKRIMVCDECGKEAFAEGTCPNEIIQSSGYLQDDDKWDKWFCSEKCKNYERKEEILEALEDD